MINDTNNIITTNILSYFIKDIKDPSELAFYKQMQTGYNIEITYKDKLLYKITGFKGKLYTILNIKKNISLDYFSDVIINNKICSNKIMKQKTLYYKKDNKLLDINYNYISYIFIYNKYLYKTYFHYAKDGQYLLMNKIKYYNGYKYIYSSIHFNKNTITHKYNYVQIFILNKYELHYFNGFFNLFFDNN